jgi:hypothetical protein
MGESMKGQAGKQMLPEDRSARHLSNPCNGPAYKWEHLMVMSILTPVSDSSAEQGYLKKSLNAPTATFRLNETVSNKLGKVGRNSTGPQMQTGLK